MKKFHSHKDLNKVLNILYKLSLKEKKKFSRKERRDFVKSLSEKFGKN